MQVLGAAEGAAAKHSRKASNSEASSSGKKHPAARRVGRKQRQLEAIAAGMLEKDAEVQNSSKAGAKAKERVRLPSFQEMEDLWKQRRAGLLPHMDLTMEEGPRIAAHLTAFSKSAKMRDSARALYINNQVGGGRLHRSKLQLRFHESIKIDTCQAVAQRINGRILQVRCMWLCG